MDWIDHVEDLTGGDFGDDPTPLLDNFDEDGELLRRVEKYLKRNEPTIETVDHVHTVLLRSINTATKAIQDTWGEAVSVSVEKQQELTTLLQTMKNKCEFLSQIHREMLDHTRWISLQGEIYTSVNHLLLEIIALQEKHPHNIKNVLRTVLYFRLHSFLSSVALSLWDKLLPQEEIAFNMNALQSVSSKNKIDLDLLVPSFRRLGMLDCLDGNWNMHGEWKAILGIFESNAIKPVQRLPVDKILNERSEIWRSARSSMRCRQMQLSSASQCFQYFPKCTVAGCPNIETPEKPHKIRCTTCWYYHCCSPACKTYTDFFQPHQCSFTPPVKSAAIKQQMDLYLQRSKEPIVEGGKSCNFCGTKRDNLPTAKMMRCSGCESVSYCSKQCQKWDWISAGHKASCRKN